MINQRSALRARGLHGIGTNQLNSAPKMLGISTQQLKIFQFKIPFVKVHLGVLHVNWGLFKIGFKEHINKKSNSNIKHNPTKTSIKTKLHQ